MTYDRDPIETSRRRSTHCLELGVGGAGSVPDYLEIGEAQFAELTEEIRSVVPRILELEELESAS